MLPYSNSDTIQYKIHTSCLLYVYHNFNIFHVYVPTSLIITYMILNKYGYHVNDVRHHRGRCYLTREYYCYLCPFIYIYIYEGVICPQTHSL